ncbi:MAG: hypothetical protein ABL961_00255 [Vicinamibacterales bacterium]
MRPLRELGLVVSGFSALTAAIFFPLSFRLSTLAYNVENGDGQFSVWNVAWVARTLIAEPRQLFDANIFHPHRWALAYSEMNLAAGAIAVPAYWATHSAYAALNFAVLASFVLGSSSMYYLCRHLTGDRTASIIGAIIFGFCPFAFAHLLHIQLLMTAGLPLSLLAFHRAVQQPTAARGAVLGLAMGFQSLACAYYSVFVVLMIGTAVMAVASIRSLWTTRQFWLMLATGAVVAVVASLPTALGYFVLRDNGYERPLDAARQYSADWRAYLASGHMLHAWMLPYLGHWKEVLFPGFLTIGAGAIGVASGWRSQGRPRETVIVYLAMVVLGAWASFGPDAGLYPLLYQTIPLFSVMRAPVRFGLIVIFGLSVLASLGIAHLRARSRRPLVVGAVLLTAALAESWISITFEPALLPHSGYHVLATMPRGPVLELPIYSRRLGFRRSRYMMDSTTHWMPLVDAYSDSIPEEFEARSVILADFPSADSLQDLRRDSVRYAVIHLDAYDDPAMRQSLFDRLDQFAPALKELYRAPDFLLYEIVGSTEPAREGNVLP